MACQSFDIQDGIPRFPRHFMFYQQRPDKGRDPEIGLYYVFQSCFQQIKPRFSVRLISGFIGMGNRQVDNVEDFIHDFIRAQ